MIIHDLRNPALSSRAAIEIAKKRLLNFTDYNTIYKGMAHESRNFINKINSSNKSKFSLSFTNQKNKEESKIDSSAGRKSEMIDKNKRFSGLLNDQYRQKIN